MPKSKLMAISGICGAVATICFVGATYFDIAGLALSVMGGSIACVPLLMCSQYRTYSILIALVSMTIAGIVGSAKILELVYYSLTIVPMAIIKGCCDNVAIVQDNTVKPHKKLKWVLYYIFMQLAITAVLLVTAWLTESIWLELCDSGLIYVVVALLQLVPIACDILFNGAFAIVKKAIIKSNMLP